MLDDRQPLIVIHGEHRIEPREHPWHEHGVRGQRSLGADAARLHPRDRGSDDAQFLVAKVAAFPRVRVQATHGDARRRDCPPARQIARQNRRRLAQRVGGNGVAHGPERQVGGGERHAQLARGQHHHHARAVRALCEKFGVTAEAHAGVVDHSLVHRRGDDGVELPAEGARHGALRQREHVRHVGRVRASGHARASERQVLDAEAAAAVRGGSRSGALRVGAQRDRQFQPCGALTQQRAVGEAHQLTRQLLESERQAQLRPDSCRLPRGQSDTRSHIVRQDGSTASPEVLFTCSLPRAL